jgi:RNA polymerase primary sigma factor
VINARKELNKLLTKHRIKTSRKMYFQDAMETGYEACDKLKGKERRTLSRNIETISKEFYNARNKLTEGNMKLVIKPAFRHASIYRYQDPEALLSEAMLGLMTGAEKYDPARGTKFSTYALWWVKQAIGRHVQDTGTTVRVPVHMTEKMHKINRSKTRFIGQYQREPTIMEIAKMLRTSHDKVASAMSLEVRMLSTNSPVSSDENETSTFADTMTDYCYNPDAFYDDIDKKNISAHIRGIIEQLPEKERDVLRIRYGFETGSYETLENTAELLHQKYIIENQLHTKVTRERIRQIEEKALARIRKPSIRKRLEEIYTTSATRYKPNQ